MSELHLFIPPPSSRSALRTRKRIDRMLYWLRSCAHCGSLELGTPMFCEACALEERSARLGAHEQEGYPFRVRSLFRWVDDGIVRTLVYSQKRGWAEQAARAWMEALSAAIPRGGRGLRFAYPGGKGRDHAWLLAEILSEIWNASSPLRLELADEKREAQHTLNAVERTWRRFKPPPASELEDSGARWVFVDDVITSGASAMGAYMALGDPEHFEVWTLACRPKLAGKSSF